jgi:hypothetical protein
MQRLASAGRGHGGRQLPVRWLAEGGADGGFTGMTR